MNNDPNSMTTKPDKPKSLPWICPKHPKAQVRHTWDESHYILNGYPAGVGIKSAHRYECAECGTELSSETR